MFRVSGVCGVFSMWCVYFCFVGCFLGFLFIFSIGVVLYREGLCEEVIVVRLVF